MNSFDELLESLGYLLLCGMSLGLGFITVVAVSFWLRNDQQEKDR